MPAHFVFAVFRRLARRVARPAVLRLGSLRTNHWWARFNGLIKRLEPTSCWSRQSIRALKRPTNTFTDCVTSP